MALERLGYIDLPPNRGAGGFDHAAVHRQRCLLYVAHTANDAVDVIDMSAGRFLRSIDSLEGVAGALVDEDQDLVFTSNRGEDTIGILRPDGQDGVAKVKVGVRPNGLAYAPARRMLLVANVGNPDVPGSHTITLVDVERRAVHASIPVPGRTRWAVFDPEQGLFFVNIMEPAIMLIIDPDGRRPIQDLAIPDRGPHGLDLDVDRRLLYCACDGGWLIRVDGSARTIEGKLELSGAPDVIFLDRDLQRLYVAIGDPGVIDVIDTADWRRVESVPTESGAHTLAIDDRAHRIYAFLPRTHRALVFEDRA